MKALDLRLLSQFLAVTTAFAIAMLSLSSSDGPPSGLFALLEELVAALFGDAIGYDKVGHYIAYAALGAFAAFGVRLHGPRALMSMAAAILLYGGLLEVIQGFTDDRTPSFADLLANALGVSTGFAAAEAAHIFLKRYSL